MCVKIPTYIYMRFHSKKIALKLIYKCVLLKYAYFLKEPELK